MQHQKHTTVSLEAFLLSVEKPVLFLHDEKSAEELRPFIKVLTEKQAVVIPTSPEAIFALDKAEIAYSIPDHYFRAEEYEAFFAGWSAKLEALPQSIDEVLPQPIPVAAFHQYAFVRMLHPLLDAYFKIGKIISVEQPDAVAVLSNDTGLHAEVPALASWLLWEPKENIFKKILSIYSFNRPVTYFGTEAPKSLVDAPKMKGWKAYILQHPRWGYLAKLLKRDKKLFYLNALGGLKNFVPLMLLNNGYEWDLCTEELYKKGYYIWGQVNDGLADWFSGEEKPYLSLEKNTRFRDCLSDGAIDLFPLVQSKIDFFMSTVAPAAVAAFGESKTLFAEKNIKGLLYAINPTAISKAIAEAARSLRIPVVGWQHGDMNYKAIPQIVYNDVISSDLFLSWGKGSAANSRAVIDEAHLDKDMKVAGSASLDNLVQQAPVAASITPLIVYATTMYYLANTYLFTQSPWSDARICQTQKGIISGLAGLPGKKVVKLHPNPFYALPALDQYCEEKGVTATRSDSITSLFAQAAVIVIDMPSTTLLQAVASGKPVFCISSHLSLSPLALELAKKRVVMAETPEALVAELKEFLETKHYKADVKNKEFLEAFGTGGGAARLAVKALSSLITHD